MTTQIAAFTQLVVYRSSGGLVTQAPLPMANGSRILSDLEGSFPYLELKVRDHIDDEQSIAGHGSNRGSRVEHIVPPRNGLLLAYS